MLHNNTKAVPNNLSMTQFLVGLLVMTECSVVAHDIADPAVVAAHTGIDAGVSLHGAVITPRHHTLKLTVTHQRTARVSLQTHTEDEQLGFTCH